jgi:selenocysteine lyase/cysteine desulfurase
MQELYIEQNIKKTMNIINKSVFSVAEIEQFRKETIGCKYVNHLNNAGAGLMPDVVTKAVTDHIKLESEIGGYEASDLKADVINEFYNQAALLINCTPSNIAFTASATDSYSKALSSIPFTEGDIILTDNDDFISNQIQFLSCKKRFAVNIVRIKNAAIGGVDLADLEEKLYLHKPRLLAITHIPTNSGLVQPVNEIAEIYSRYEKQYGDRTWYILDACQSVGQMKLDVQLLKCDFLTVTNRKFLRGPRGTGFLYISDKALQAKLEPLFIDMRGADWIKNDEYRQQPDAKRFEYWEFSHAAVLGSSEAISYCRNIGEDRIRQQVNLLSAYLRIELSQIKNVKVLDRGPALSASVTFSIKNSSPDLIIHEYLQNKINVVATFREFALIDFDEKQVDWAVRASPHYYNTLDELNGFIKTTGLILSKLN